MRVLPGDLHGHFDHDAAPEREEAHSEDVRIGTVRSVADVPAAAQLCQRHFQVRVLPGDLHRWLHLDLAHERQKARPNDGQNGHVQSGWRANDATAAAAAEKEEDRGPELC